MEKRLYAELINISEGHDLVFTDYRLAMSPHNDIVEKNFDEKALFCMVKMDMDVWWVHFFDAILHTQNTLASIYISIEVHYFERSLD